MRSIKYIPAIDGLRAIAVAGVIIFHITARVLPGGYLGVDAFFVISGFLITSMIVNGINDGSFSFKEFYLRRIQRLVPNVIVTVVATIGIYWLFMPANEIRLVVTHALWVLFSLSNIYIYNNIGGYWGESAEFAPLTHTWSLGVEEQFYWIFPLILLVLSRYLSKHLRFWFIALAVSSYVLHVLLSHSGHLSFVFYMLPTRMWELFTGAILSMLVTPVKGDFSFQQFNIGTKLANILGLLGTAMLIASYFLLDGNKLAYGEIVLIPVLGSAFIIIAAMNQSTLVSMILSAKPFVKTGRASYSLYLWHWPMIIFWKRIFLLHSYMAVSHPFIYNHLEKFGAIFGGLFGIMMGLLVYFIVEKPLRDHGQGRSRRLKIIATMLLIAVALCLAAIRCDSSQRLESKYDKSISSIYLYDTNLVEERPDLRNVTRYSDVDFIFEDNLLGRNRWKEGGILRLYGKTVPSVVVIGSSHALMYSKTIDDICRERKLSVAFFGRDACKTLSSSFRQSDPFYQEREKMISEWRPDCIIVIEKWDGYRGHVDEFDTQFRDFLDSFRGVAKHVIFVSQIPVLNIGPTTNPRYYALYRNRNNDGLAPIHPDKFDIVRRQIAEDAETLHKSYPFLTVIRPDKLMYNNDGSVIYANKRTFYYLDDDHLSDAGSDRMKPIFEQAIIQSISSNPQ